MTKAAAFTVVGTAGTALAAGGAYILGAFNSPVDLEIPDSLDQLKKGPKIISHQFPGLDFSSEGDDWATSKPANNFLGDLGDSAMGRLVVNWEKYKSNTDQSDKKWGGGIRWLWTLANKDKGLMVYLSAKSGTEDAKLSVEGIIYALSKEGNEGNKKWTIKHSKKLDTSSATITEVDNKLPTVSDTIFKNTLKVRDYWGFLKSDAKALTDLCKSATINKDNAKSKETFRGSWVWRKGSGNDQNQTPLDWSKTDHQWISSLFSNPQPKLSELLTNFKGTWTEEYFANKDLGVEEQKQK